VSGTWEPYASTPESTITGELLVHRELGRELLVLLPPGYGAGGSYPVLYAQDGQNRFDEATAHTGEWLVDERMAQLAGEGSRRSSSASRIAATAARASTARGRGSPTSPSAARTPISSSCWDR
jgi:hypothetical protein